MKRSMCRVGALGFLAVAMWLPGCATDPRLDLAKQAVERKEWDVAAENAGAVYREDPESRAPAKLLKQILPSWYPAHEDLAKKAVEAQNWDEAVRQADAVKAMDSLVAGHKELSKIPVPELSSLREESAAEAAVTHYALAVSLESEGRWKEAAKEFKITQTFAANYQDSAARYAQNREKAMQKVVVLSFDDPAGDAAPGIGEGITSGIANAVRRSTDMQEFMKLVTTEEFQLEAQKMGLQVPSNLDAASAAALGKQVGVHAIVVGDVTSVITTYPSDITQSFSRSGTITKYVTHADGTVTSYEVPVYASVTYFERAAEATVSANFRIVDVATASIVKDGQYTGRQVEAFKWARYSGDEAALTSQDSTLARQPEGRPKPRSENIAIAARQVVENFSGDISMYFNQ